MEVSVLPISGDSHEWQCALLRIGTAKVLLNCGWTESLDPDLFKPLLPYIEEIDLIVLTHPDVKHLGGLPYLLSRHSVQCPVVCTEAVCRLGELSCVAAIEEREKYQAPVKDYDVDDVLKVFMSRIKPLSFRQTFHRQARGRPLLVCPYPAGGHLGSSYWTIQSGSFSAVYFVDFEMRRGRYLDGFDLSPLLPSNNAASQRWDLVITSNPCQVLSHLPVRGAGQEPPESFSASRSLSAARTVREQRFLEETISTLRRGGSVLIPADTMGCTPEVLLLLEAAWSQDRQLATNYPVVWLSTMGDVVLDQVKTRLEYMSREVLSTFETRFGQHPFILRNVRVFQTLDELRQHYPLSRPQVILASAPHLETGDSRELFLRLCGEPRNLLWVLGVPAAGTLARQLLDDFVVRHASRKEYKVAQRFREPLPDAQLRAFCEEKWHELTRNGGSIPDPPASLTSGVDFMTLDEARASRQSGEDGAANMAARAEARVLLARAKEMQGSLLWAPLGWPSSRTVGFTDSKCEGDEYGHLLFEAELNTWKAQDQEGNRYSFTAGAAEGSAPAFAGAVPAGAASTSSSGAVAAAVVATASAASAPPPATAGAAAAAKAEELKEEKKEEAEDTKAEVKEAKKEEPVDLEDAVPKVEVDDAAASAAAATRAEALAMEEWRASLRMHFREPMRYEAREKTVRVESRVLFLPDSCNEPRDLPTLISVISPRRVVLLPGDRGHRAAAEEDDLVRQLRCNTAFARCQGRDAQPDAPQVPEVHVLQGSASTWETAHYRPKRKLAITQEAWQKVSFAKIADGARVARLHGKITEGSIDARIPELGSLETDKADAGAANEPGPAEKGDHALPRGGALFVGLGQGPLQLSSLKEQLLGESWCLGEVEFHAPRPSKERTWTSRVLAAGGRAALSWADSATERQSLAEDRPDAADGRSAVAPAEGGGTAPRALRLEGVPGEHFFWARSALYKACAVV